MGNLPETKQGVLMELRYWQDLVQTEQWVVFRKLLASHCDFLQNEANEYLRKHEDRQAGESLRAMDDCKKILSLVTSRINQLNKQSEKMED